MRARVLTALALIPPVLAAIFLTTPWPLIGLGVVALWIGFSEAANLLQGKPAWAPVFGTAVFAAASATALGYVETNALVLSGLAILNVLGLIVAARFARGRLGLEVAGMWIAAPLSALVILHGLAKPSGEALTWASPLLMSVVPLWGGDTAAIFAGRALGKHPLAPAISPKKTVEGAVANLFACVLVAWGLGYRIGLAWPASVACGLAAGVFGQAGDLFESALKRRSGLKDSGTLLPGHGGLLDRIDSILFTAVPVLAIVWLWPVGR